MKKLFTVIAILVILVGCSDVGPSSKDTTYSRCPACITYRYEGCEYVVIDAQGSGITHKGNCDNPIHD